MNEGDKEISLHFENDVLSAMISMFGQLQEVESSMDGQISKDCKSLTIRRKEPQEIIKFNFDYKLLETKIFKWIDSGQECLQLNKEESEKFRACSHAAYFYMMEEIDSEDLRIDPYVKFHERFIKNK